MPIPVPPKVEVAENLIKKKISTVVVTNRKGKFMPVVHCAVGKEDMEKEKIADNILAIFKKVVDFIKVHQKIKNVYVKKTMSKAVYIEA